MSSGLVTVVIVVAVTLIIVIPFLVFVWDQVIIRDPYEPEPPEDEA